jgi:membrane protein DedA with SNARE-associated domain
LQAIADGGYWGIVLLMALENIFPPIPSEVIMGMGGIAVAQGRMEVLPLMLAGTVGSTLGNYPWFLLGRWATNGCGPSWRGMGAGSRSTGPRCGGWSRSFGAMGNGWSS